MKSQTSTGYFSNSTGSSVTNRWFSPSLAVDNVGLKNVFWGPRTPWLLWYFFVGVNQSGPGTSSTSNHIIYTALGDDFMVHYVNMEGHGAPRVVGMEPR